jgi:NADPH2:quinone reductase
MKAVWYSKTGPAAEVLTIGQLPDPVPQAGEVLIRVRASGLNPADCNRRAGRGYAMEAPLVIPQSDGAGIVVEIGSGVDASWKGRRVWLYNGQRGRAFGTAAELIALDVGLVAELPANTSFAQGACLGIPCMTAWCAVHSMTAIEGRTVLVTGGGGAVGNYAIQLARRAGARVLATASRPESIADAYQAGASEVINYRREIVADRIQDITGGAGVDHIVEVDFGANLAASLAVLKNNGSIAAYASRGNEQPLLPFYSLMRKNITLRAIYFSALPPEFRRRAQEDIVRWLEDGSAQHRIVAYPLSQTVAAHDAVEAGTKRGTVVVEIE